eukprot:454725_1
MPIKVEIGGVEDKLRLVIKSEYRKGMKMRKIFSEITNHLDKKYVVKKFKKHEIDVIHSGFTGAIDNIIDIGNKSLTEYDVNEITSKGLSVEVSVSAHNAAIFGCVVQLMLMVPAIVAMIIAAVYEKSTSPCDGRYTMDLDTFLFVVGGVKIVYGLYYVWNGGSTGNVACYDAVEAVVLVIMAIIGLVMRDNQFSDECQDEPIADMILTWSIIPFVQLFVGCFFPYGRWYKTNIN